MLRKLFSMSALSFIITFSAIANDHKINCNDAIYSDDSLVSQALYAAGIAPAPRQMKQK